MRPVVVDWLDHADLGGESAWTKIDDIAMEPARVRTVGYLVRESADAIVIAHSAGDGECSTPFLIVRSAIVDLQPLTLPAVRKRA